MSELLHGEITHDIIGAFYDTYNVLGWGYPESIYANAMPIFLRRRGLQLEREVVFPVALEGVALGEFRADLVVAHEAQLISYLRSSKLELGLLLNFGPKPERRRVIWTDDIHGLAVAVESTRGGRCRGGVPAGPPGPKPPGM